MVWPIAPDRLSPSGPILPFLQGSIIQIGSDQPRVPLFYDQDTPEEVFFLPRTQDPGALPVQVALQGYTPGNGILINWTTGSGYAQGEPGANVLILAIPVVNVGDPLQVGSTLLINNAFNAQKLEPPGGLVSDFGTDVWTHQALVVPPADLIVADPVVGLLMGVSFELDGTLILGGGEFDFDTAETPPTSCWLQVAEIDARAIPAVAPTTLLPLPF